jgi:hypothetical protein
LYLDPDHYTESAQIAGSGFNESGSATLRLTDKNLRLYLFSRLADPVPFKGSQFQKKKLPLQEGQSLPATFSFCKDRFVFVVQRDLTVFFNGTK